MADGVAIKVDNVSKSFRLPHEKQGSVKNVFVNAFRGKKTFEKQQVLKNVSFEVKKGEFFGIVGRNGSGKSTLLKLLAGIYSPDSGAIRVSGKLTPFIELGVGFNPDLTGRENVYLNGALLGFSRQEMNEMYEEIVEFAELEKFMDQKLKNYSSGMQVRLAFSIAVKVDSPILLLDEVLAVGDAAFQRKCYDYFNSLKENNRTVIFISHDMNAIREFCDRACLIDKGEAKAVMTPDIAAQEYSKLFSKKQTNIRSEQNRSGTGDARVEKIKLVKRGGFYNIKVTHKFYKKVERPVFGMTICSPTGAKIFETNTKIKNITTGSYNKNDKAEVTWKVHDMFRNGQNTISLAVSNESTNEFFDWWINAASLFISDKEPTAAEADIPCEVEIRNE